MANNSKASGISGFGFIGLIVLARVIMNYSDAKANKMIKEERRAIRCAKGEVKIGSILENLDEDYLVIHHVESPFGNIDHIVISKQSGVFLVETKARGGKVSVNNGHLLVNGHEPEKNFIAQCLNNTYWPRDKICEITNIPSKGAYATITMPSALDRTAHETIQLPLMVYPPSFRWIYLLDDNDR